ncbi:MAG: NTP transferase domain-containing protein [Actinobacteria bacterium]|nr:NTP transferase domain-containing protein [Actinomycetota bacterium]
MSDLVLLAAGMARRYGGFKPLAPVGPCGEAIIDLTVYDAAEAGFDRVVLVVRKEIEGALSYHVKRCWPTSLEVELVCQDEDAAVEKLIASGGKPPGTAHAVLVAARRLSGSFGVANADDLYSKDALCMLADHLGAPNAEHALVAFRLKNTVVSDSPVTRATCVTDELGLLTEIHERTITPLGGGSFLGSTDHGKQPLTGDALVSVNLWGLRPSIVPVLESAVEPFLAAIGSGAKPTCDEVLLPVIIGSTLGKLGCFPVRVLTTESRCIGVTHPSDLPKVQAEVAKLVSLGLRPAQLWK